MIVLHVSFLCARKLCCYMRNILTVFAAVLFCLIRTLDYNGEVLESHDLHLAALIYVGVDRLGLIDTAVDKDLSHGRET